VETVNAMVNGGVSGSRGGGSVGICDGGHPPAVIDGSSMTATGNATVTAGEMSAVGCCSASTTQHHQQLMTHGGGGCESIASGSITAACSASAGGGIGGDTELVGVGGVDDQVSRNSSRKSKTWTATSFFLFVLLCAPVYRCMSTTSSLPCIVIRHSSVCQRSLLCVCQPTADDGSVKRIVTVQMSFRFDDLRLEFSLPIVCC
jgi:hypothetical protein